MILVNKDINVGMNSGLGHHVIFGILTKNLGSDRIDYPTKMIYAKLNYRYPSMVVMRFRKYY